jgi:carboxyl-terminal processing protease
LRLLPTTFFSEQAEASQVNKKFALKLITVVLAVGTFSICFAQQKPRSSSTTNSSGRATTNSSRRNTHIASDKTAIIEKDLEEALRIIERHYVLGSKLDYNAAFKSSIVGMLRSLDPHSNYYDRDEYEELKTDQRSEYFGIGASIQNYFLQDDADTFITATFQNSPAARAGLRFGDRIVAVDGLKMTGKPSLEVRDKIRGPRGSAVKITIERAADKRLQTVEITRDVVPQPSIPDAYMIKPGVAYVDMTRGFNISTTEELQDALDQLHARGMNSLVLDLRNNPGGFLDQAIHVAEVFLPSGELILTQKGRNGLRDNTYRSANRSADPVPLVILINENTASASEIVAGAMQDHDRALIVGETSFGKGLVQSIIPLDYGAGLTLTSAKYYTPSGRLIQRDYADSGLYDYYTHGSRRSDEAVAAKPVRQEKKTDSGRPVYGGGGIAPDEPVGGRTITMAQRRLSGAIFAFARELVNGRIPAPANYRVRGAINFDHELKANEFVISDSIVGAFKDFVVADPLFKNMSNLVDHNRDFVELQLRFNLVQAAYGRVMAERVFVLTDDKQLAKAVDVLPRARDLAMTATHHTQP